MVGSAAIKQGRSANRKNNFLAHEKAEGELIVWDSSLRACVRPSVRATDMDLGAFLVVWR